MRKIIGLIFVSAFASALLSDAALAWDNCGVGSHRTAWGECVSNWAHGPGMRGCPWGYHLDNWVHACVPNY
jgi:hypothetical protein